MAEPHIALPAPPASVTSLAAMIQAVATPAMPAPLLCCLKRMNNSTQRSRPSADTVAANELLCQLQAEDLHREERPIKCLYIMYAFVTATLERK